MTYPRIEISLEKILHNTKKLIEICNKKNISVAGVTKVFCAHPKVAKALVDGGVTLLADSRIENLERLKSINIAKMLLRIPMISEADKVVEFADISLNSELDTIKRLSEEAVKRKKVHKILVMVDLGDLREGIFEKDELFQTIDKALTLKGISLIGLGTNLTCYGGVIPSYENLNKLVNLSKEIEEKFKIKMEIISGGNSSSLHLIQKDEIPKGINQLRLGESIVLGRETAYGNRIEDTFDDCFKLVAEIVEIKVKPSVPIGEIGMDAFGKKPTFIDKGLRKRAICAIGKQDIDINDIMPDDTFTYILGASSDHLILDITDSPISYKVGDKIEFKLTYGGILKAMTSNYVKKKII